jgi:ferrochelatase
MKTGILITNLGTPDAPTKSALKCYLNEFLSDTRVVNFESKIKKILWKVLLHVVILKTRPEKVAQNYAKIWNTVGKGSPLLSITRLQLKALAASLSSDSRAFEMGMRYGNPSISQAIQNLMEKECNKIIVFHFTLNILLQPPCQL